MCRRVFEVIDHYSNGGRPALVFCASRNGVRTTAERIQADSRSAAMRSSSAAARRGDTTPNGSDKPNTSVFLRDARHARTCSEAAARVRDNRLAECLRAGVGFHSAAEAASDRSIVEALFRSGDLPVLCTTSTLAMGVNLPAHLVVIKSTAAWRGPGIGYAEYSRGALLQMMGRAGRPQFDTSGAAVIMTSTSRAATYRSAAGGLEPVESTLGASLIEHLAAEVVLRTVDSVGAAVEWLRSTFFFLRIRVNPTHYGARWLQQQLQQHQHQMARIFAQRHQVTPLASSTVSDSATHIVTESVDAFLAKLVTEHIYALYSAGCVRLMAKPSAARLAAEVAVSASNALVPLTGLAQTRLDGSIMTPDEESASRGVPESDFHPTSIAALSSAGASVSVCPLTPASILSRHYLRFETMALFPAMARGTNVEELLAALCGAKEIISGLVLRRDDRKVRCC